MDKVYFVQGDNLLLPSNVSETQIADGVPRELVRGFENPDVFEISSIDDSPEPIGVVSVLPGTQLPKGWRSVPVRQVLTMFVTGTIGGGGSSAQPQAARVLRACHIAQWRNDSRFCGTCGAKNTDGSPEPHRVCPVCGRLEYPRICPAVIIIITDDNNRILLAHNKKFRAGVYSHISGFNESGETLEATIVREIREEVNIEVKDIEYIKSQSWPFPSSLMIGYKARYASGELKPDGIEIEDAKWFTKDNLPELPAHGSLSRFLIECWRNS